MNNNQGYRPLRVKTLLFLITFAITLFIVLQNISPIFMWMRRVIGFFSPVIVGCCIAFVFNVPLCLFEDHLFKKLKTSEKNFARKLCRPLSLFFAAIVCLGIVGILLLVIIPNIMPTLETILSALPKLFGDVMAWVENLLQNFNIAADALPNIRIDWDKFFTIIENFLSNDSGQIVGDAVNITAAIIGGAMDLIFSIIIAIYILAKKERLGVFCKRLIHVFIPERIEKPLYRVINLANKAFSNFITGQVTEALVLGSLCFIGMKIFDFPYASVVSVVMGITALVPIVGAFAGAIIGFFFIMIANPLKAVLFLPYILILQQLEGNLIYPHVVGKSVGLPSILVLSAVLVGGNIGGVGGALAGVPVCAVLYALLNELLDRQGGDKVQFAVDRAFKNKAKSDTVEINPKASEYSEQDEKS